MLFFRSLQTEVVVEASDVELLQVFSKPHRLPQVKCSPLHWSNLSWWEEAQKRVINAPLSTGVLKVHCPTFSGFMSVCKGDRSPDPKENELVD